MQANYPPDAGELERRPRLIRVQVADHVGGLLREGAAHVRPSPTVIPYLLIQREAYRPLPRNRARRAATTIDNTDYNQSN